MVVFRILGPVEADVDTRPAALGRRQQRALLALLVLHANRVVPRDVLVENLWDDPPESAVTAMHGYVSGLRKVLGKDTIQTCAPGYVLTVEPETSDLERFERALTVAERLDPESARATLESALALWRGRALADVDDFPFARTEQGRLEELRLQAIELRVAADLSLGQHRKVVPDGTPRARHPLPRSANRGPRAGVGRRAERRTAAPHSARSARDTGDRSRSRCHVRIRRRPCPASSREWRAARRPEQPRTDQPLDRHDSVGYTRRHRSSLTHDGR